MIACNGTLTVKETAQNMKVISTIVSDNKKHKSVNSFPFK